MAGFCLTEYNSVQRGKKISHLDRAGVLIEWDHFHPSESDLGKEFLFKNWRDTRHRKQGPFGCICREQRGKLFNGPVPLPSDVANFAPKAAIDFMQVWV